MQIRNRHSGSNKSNGVLRTEVPGGSAWYGAEMASRADWIERLGAGEVAEIESAVRRLEESRIELTKITPEHVPLPTLARRLHTILDEVLNGRGCITTD